MSLADNLIFMITPVVSEIPAGGVLPLTTIARRTGRVLRSGNNSVLLGLPGYYKVNITATFTAPAEGDVNITLQKNSLDVPGITATTTISTATTETRSLALSGVIRVMPFENIATLTILNNGVAIETSNISIDVEYLG